MIMMNLCQIIEIPNKYIFKSNMNLKNHDWSTITAIWGATTGTLALSLNAFDKVRDRSILRIRLARDMKIIGPAELAGYDNNKTYLMVTVTNKGRRPINVDRVFVRQLRKGKTQTFFVVHNQTSRILTEENPVTQFPIDQEGVDYDRLYYVVILDKRGREYKKYYRRFPRLWKIYMYLRYRLK